MNDDVAGNSRFALEGLTESRVDEFASDPSRSRSSKPGPYRTGICQKNHYHAHPAYADPSIHVSRLRQHLVSSQRFVTKAAVVIEQFSRLEDAPIRFPLRERTVTR
ncbi:hypothetical protein JVU11DRAFT_8838 [Chiua virens]|nr:hypothetical protein JVU11DRAFT_8838 [Chiua virens]